MPNLPIEFSDNNVVVNSTCHLSFNFDQISSIEVDTVEEMDIKQPTPIKAMHLELAGRTSNPNISVSLSSVTRLFTLNSIYITSAYPRNKKDQKKICFVIEGYSIENVDKERVLIFLPMNPVSTTNNLFYPIESTILNQTVMESLNLNTFIPNINIETDAYSYFTHPDDSGTLFHMVVFSNSSLGYSAQFSVPSNSGYEAPEVKILNKSTTLALHHNNMTNQFEDNIYIDCVPVDVVNKKEETYMQVDKMSANYFTDMIVIFTYMIAISLLVYGIYYFYIYMGQPNKS
jgi:hypothetical protein